MEDITRAVLFLLERDFITEQLIYYVDGGTEDLTKAARSDPPRETVDYRAVNADILAAFDGSQYHLADALAERVAETCLVHGAVHRVQVTVDKPGALRFAGSVAVEIERSRG